MMLKTYFNFFIYFMLIIFSSLIFFIENIFIKWMFLELFTLIFIGYLNFNNNNKISSLIYFFISSITSLIIFMNFIYLMNYFFLKSNFKINSILMLSMFLKLGIFPFNLWMIFSFPFLSWLDIFIFSTFTKIIPMNLISISIPMNLYLLIFLIINGLMASLLALEENSIKKILAFSSMNHSSYLIIISFLNSKSFIIYLLIYILNTYLLIYILNTFYIKNKILMLNLNLNKKMNYTFILIIFIYSMFPPFSTFLMKWFFFNENILIFNSIFFLIILTISSIIMMWNYLNIMNFQFTLYKLTKKTWFKFPKFYIKKQFSLIISISLFFFLNFYIFII